MDKFSHIKFAAALLNICNERTDMAYLSILPLIDGEPSFLHRLHCHPVVKIPVLVDAAKYVYGSTATDNVPMPEHAAYEVRRLRESNEEISGAFQKAIAKNGDETMKVDDGFGAILSALSHTYFDTYNNAVQAFAPYDNYCAGQYDMWKRIDDYFNFRIKWYRQTAPMVCESVLQELFWNRSYSSKALVKGMIRRLAALTRPAIGEETINKVEIRLGVNDIPGDDDINDFYIQLETSISENLVESVNTLTSVPAI